MLSLLYADKVAINDQISIHIPTLGEIIDCGEEAYYGFITALTAMPIDLMVELDDIGYDFTEIDEYQLFLMLFPQMQKTPHSITSMVFGDLNLAEFELWVNPQNDCICLKNHKSGVIIDGLLHEKIATTLRHIHHLTKDRRMPGNKNAKQYMIKRARIKKRRNRSRQSKSQLEPLIISMVNTQQFKYDFESTKNLTIYQFNESVKQVIRKIDYDNRMYGVYAGTIDTKKLSQDALTWLSD